MRFIDMLAAGLSFFAFAGCDSDVLGGGCTEAGCGDSLSLTLRAPGNVWQAGIYGFEFEFDGVAHACAEVSFPDDLPTAVGTRLSLDCEPELAAAFQGQVICTETRSQDAVTQSCRPVSGQFKLAVTVSATPESFRARATRDGEIVLETEQEPEYEEERPNGPDCEPVCRQAQVELDLH